MFLKSYDFLSSNQFLFLLLDVFPPRKCSCRHESVALCCKSVVGKQHMPWHFKRHGAGWQGFDSRGRLLGGDYP